MTNEQLVVWINNYRNQLKDALREVELLLPEDIKSHGETLIGEKTSWYDQTQPINEILSRLDTDIENLGGKSN